ncbi:hypothetical protein [Azonexus hydrophilus]|uniref:hypothetical protein n=1 Tax=Azonexus hydrophilus TaxID=418702 RepID=UPI001963E024|nr:hypothetical protein [Azonexus hydrophilus]
MIPAAVPLAAFATSSIVSSIVTLYGVATDVNDWMNKHILSMQESENITVSRTGKVLEGAKFGFGLGYAAPIIAIATGQMLLGNPLSVITTVATAATISNPIAMTCASIGAIYYGWNALNDSERNDILDKLSRGLEIGIELIKSIIQYILNGIASVVTSNNVKLLKEYIEKEAAVFGRTLYDITRSATDKVIATLNHTVTTANSVIEASVEAASVAGNTLKSYGSQCIETVKTALPSSLNNSDKNNQKDKNSRNQ